MANKFDNRIYFAIFCLFFCIQTSLSKNICASHEYELNNSLCCSKCPAGFGILQNCTAENDTYCEPCEHGKTFSPNFAHTEQCHSCSKCDDHAHVLHLCNITHDTACECNRGFYLDTSVNKCKLCDLCPHGYGAIKPCNGYSNTQCQSCPEGTYSRMLSNSLGCTVCSVCREDQIMLQECTSIQDTLCEDKENGRFAHRKSTLKSVNSNERDAAERTELPTEHNIIPVYCAILGLIVLGLLIYVIMKQRENKGKTKGSSEAMIEKSSSLNSSVGQILANEKFSDVLPLKLSSIPSSRRRDVEMVLNKLRPDKADWRGFAAQLGYSSVRIANLEKKGRLKHGPMRYLMSELNNREKFTISDLVKALQAIGRYDAICILCPHMEKTIKGLDAGEMV